jgi:malic enzyme
VDSKSLSKDYILPHATDTTVGSIVAKAVAQAAIDSGVARLQ